MKSTSANRTVGIAVVTVLLGAIAILLRISDAATPMAGRLVSVNDRTRNMAYDQATKMSAADRDKLASALMTSMKDKKPAVRRFSLYASRKFLTPTTEVLQSFIAMLQDPDPTVKNEAIVALVESGVPAVAVLMREMSKSNDPNRATVAGILIRLGSQAVPALTEALDKKTISFRGDAINILGKIGPEANQAVPVLTRYLSDSDFDLRFKAAKSLVAIDPKNGAPVGVLIEALKKFPWNADRLTVVDLLKKMGPSAKGATPALEAVLVGAQDGENKPRAQVADALNAIEGGRPGMKELTAGLKKKRAIDRYLAVYQICQIKTIDPALTPDLIECLSDGDPYVAGRASMALARIGFDQMGALRGDALAGMVRTLGRVKDDKFFDLRSVLGPTLSVMDVELVLPTMTCYKRREMDLVTADDILGWTGKKAEQALKNYINNVDYNVRLLAALALARLGNSNDDVILPLQKALLSDDLYARARAKETLEKMTTPEAIGVLADQ